jgi:RNA polymerase sigma-70 factor (ECF subfamily)
MNAVTFKELYMPYHTKMYRIAYRLLEDAEDAEDAVQEAYIKLWNKKDELNSIENIESYCMVMLRNLCFDFLRTKSKIKTQAIDETCIAEEEYSLPDIEHNNEINHIESIISRLPQQQRQIIHLRHIGDYSSDEIGQIMGISSTNVRVLLSRARKKIKELLHTNML